MKSKRIGFFTRVLLSIGDFRIYPFAQKETLGVAISYLLKLTLISAIIISWFSLVKIYNNSCEMFDEFNNKSSDFLVKEGNLIANKTSSGELIEDVYFLIDDNKSSGDVKEAINFFPKTAYGIVLLFQDNVYVAHKYQDGEIQAIKLGYNEVGISSRTELINTWKEMNESYTTRLLLLFSMIPFIFILLIFIRGWAFLIYLCIAYMVNSFFGAKLKLGGYIKVAAYSSTVPLILDTIAIAVLSYVPQMASFIQGIICFIYTFYGIRAIRIDELFMSGIGKTPEERITDAILKAQKEIEEQLRNAKKDDKEVNKKEDKTKDNSDDEKK